MSRSYRSLIVAAVVGLIALAFGVGLALGGDWTRKPYEQSEKPYASAHAYRAAQIRGSFAAYPIEESNRCYSAKDHDSADLCAQWRAAIAAEKAANSSVWANRLAIIGMVLSGVGLAALVITIQQGRAGLERAREANDIAQNTAKRELRAYVGIDNVEIECGDRGCQILIFLKNYGGTPATRVVLDVDVGGKMIRPDRKEFHCGVLDPGSEQVPQFFIAARSGNSPMTGIVLKTVMRYRDAFDRTWERGCSYTFSDIVRLDLPNPFKVSGSLSYEKEV